MGLNASNRQTAGNGGTQSLRSPNKRGDSGATERTVPMISSVNSNPGSALALQSLNRSNSNLESIQDRISTGRKVDGPRPDPSTFAIAQQLLGEIGGTTAVGEGLRSAEATTSVAIEAGRAVGDLLTGLKRVSVQASQEGLDKLPCHEAL